jgi:hypothetical protein
MNPISKSKKAKVYAKTDGQCAYCGLGLSAEMFAIDHVHPRASGGNNAIENLMPACNPCNASKGSKSIEHYRLYVAARAVTGGPVFGHAQLVYLKEAGALPVLGIDESYLFHFERFGGVSGEVSA